MKIGIESQRIFRSHKHGMDVVAIELIRQLQQIDTINEYTIFAKRGPDTQCIHETRNFRVQQLKGLSYGDWEQISLPRALRKFKPALVHCTANTAPLICPVPLVLTLHDIIFLLETSFRGTAYQNFGNIYRRLVVPPAIRKAREIITVSEQEKMVIARECRIDPDKISVVYNAADDRFNTHYSVAEKKSFRDAHRLPGEFILHLGNTAPKKNTDRMIEAYVHYARRHADPLPLVVADYPEYLVMRTLEDLHATTLRSLFYLPGYMPSAEMPLLYNCCNIFVYPSLLESFGMPVLEAMACGKPVITSQVAALQEVGGDAAVYIQPDDVMDITGAIEKLLSDSQSIERHKTAGLARAKQFSWRTSAEKLLSIYHRVAG